MRGSATPSTQLADSFTQSQETMVTGFQRRQRNAVQRVLARDGVPLAVYDYGVQSPSHTVVFLHGLCLSTVSWVCQIEYLLRRYEKIRIISYDHRGHGRSGSAPMRTYRIDQLADDLAQVLETLDVTGPTTLVGHSMGGMVALAYLGRPTTDRPVDPSGLVLVATSAGNLVAHGLGRLLGTPATGALFDLIAHTPDQVLRGLAVPMRASLNRLCGSRSMQCHTLPSVVISALASTQLATAVGFLPSLRSYDQYRVLGSIRAQTVIVSGGADLLTPATHSTRLSAAIPGAVHVHVPAAGHMLAQEIPHVVHAAICRTATPRCGRSCPHEVGAAAAAAS